MGRDENENEKKSAALANWTSCVSARPFVMALLPLIPR